MRAAAAVSQRIVKPGRNCWQLERADHFYAIQDGDYFRYAREALLGARHTVFILGWDITARTDLMPGAPASDAPRHLDELIAYIARRRPRLRVYILVWDYGLLYSLERDPFSRWRFGWRMPRGVRFGFDDHHPVGAAHHQKILVADDALAFCGGMDLTGHRWDTPAHRPDEPGRVTPLGKHYGPYHEVQAMVDGPVAASLGVLARDRWHALGARRLPPVHAATDNLWPSDVVPDFTDVDVAIARTVPGSATEPPIRECEALFLDSIAQATESIYIENQYFTSPAIGDALGARLGEPDGPEVIVVLPKRGDGWLEQNTIERLRDDVIRRLMAADRHKRLRLVHPMASRARDVPTFVHSKVMIVDDTLVRVGSANTASRSLGVDTECDLAVDAAGDPGTRVGVRRVRDRLVGEHLGLPVEAVGPAIERAGSLRALIDAHEHADRTLSRLDPPAGEETAPSDVVRSVVDPDEPIGFGAAVERLVPPLDPSLGRVPLRIWVVPSAVLIAAIMAAWIWSDSFRRTEFPSAQSAIEALRRQPLVEAIGAGVFVLAGLAMIPLELLVIACAVLLGALRGGVVAFIGSIGAAAIGYAIGHAIGPDAIGRWISRRSYRSVRQLGRRGVVGVALVHLSSVASAGAVHLLCGAARVPFGRYLAGTMIGLLPAIAALSGLGGLLGNAILDPTLANLAVAAGAGLMVIALAAGLRTILLIRQFGASLSRQRDRAEFG
jgi:phospholipase D1/2